MKQVFVLGSMNMDFIYKMDQIPKVGESLFVDDFITLPGGKGANQAIACQKQGVKTYMLGSLGDDQLSRSILSSLNQFQVNTEYVQNIDSSTSGTACILMEKDDNRILVHPGANNIQDYKTIEMALKTNAFENDILLLQLEIPKDIILKTVKLAKSLSMKIVLNAAPYKDHIDDILSYVDLLIVNKSEAESLLKMPYDSYIIDEMLDLMIEKGPTSVILTLGVDGSYYKYKKQTIYTPSYPVNVVDTTGAGDAFIGCFVANDLLGDDIELALKKASVCGAITVQSLGVHNAIPFKEDINEFLSSKGV